MISGEQGFARERRALSGDSAGSERLARVLFLHPSNELYGSDTSLLYLLRGLDRSRFYPSVILANDLPYEGLLGRELEASGIECRSLPIAVARRKYLSPTGLAGFLQRVRQSSRMVAEIIEREQFDIVHTNTLAVWTGARAARRTRRLHNWHIREQLEHPQMLVQVMQRFVPSHSTHVIGVSQAVLENILVTPEARAKGRVIYNGADPTVWLNAPGRERIRAELGCGSDEVIIGIVARISRMKATDLCVEAVARLMAYNSHVHCLIAGAPVLGQTEMMDQVRAVIAASPAPERFHLLGERRDAPDLMAGLDILAAPSRTGEGASLSIIQGMFSGRPVVATDVGGNKELVAHGETGFIIPREDVTALTQALGALVADEGLRARMGAAGRARAIERFSLTRVHREFNDFLWGAYQESLVVNGAPTVNRAPAGQHATVRV
ncbi:MAG TPA: glycosyltransferase [Ktedonobacterales bacterium]|nr:glycosyltransferase [Ktedonobacterales bacterium]